MISHFGLYIHIPFCQSKCYYCDFPSETLSAHSHDTLETYVRYLCNLISSQTFHTGQFSTIYIGGGTPSLISPDLFKYLLQVISAHKKANAEWTIEANPESLTPTHLKVFQECGVTRLSLGIQSFRDPVLEKVGRVTRQRHLVRAKEMLTDWGGDLNLDLICGLPGQDEQTQKKDLETVLTWNPHHISWYSLSVEEDTPLEIKIRSKEISPMDEDTVDNWWLWGRDTLEREGFSQYEISNFARTGHEGKHNEGYWRLDPYLGLGCNAVSTLPNEEHQPLRFAGPSDISIFLERPFLSPEVLSPGEFEKETFMMGLRTRKGISKEIWSRRFSKTWQERIPRTLKKYANHFASTAERLALTPQGLLTLNPILVDIFSELDQEPPHFCNWAY